MKALIQPYLSFGGHCEEALEFYKKALGAQTDMLMRFSESPEPLPECTLKPGYENKIMHCSFRIGDTIIMASDGCGEPLNFSGISLSLAVDSEAEAQKAFTALADGGTVTMPLGKTFWSPCFGMIKDRFGLGWMIIVPAEMP